MRYILLFLSLLALPCYATDTVVADRDGVTTPVVLRSAAFKDYSSFATKAQGAKADSALQPSSDATVKAVYTKDSTLSQQAVMKRLGGVNGALFFQNYTPNDTSNSNLGDLSAHAAGFQFYRGPLTLPNNYVYQKVVTPADAWNLFPAMQNLIEDHNLGVTGNIDGTNTRSQIFAQWLVTASPLATDPAAPSWGIINQEINVFNRYGDTGYGDSRGDLARWSVGQQIVPEANLNVFTGSMERGYNGSFGTVYARSGNSPNPAAKWYVGTVYEQDSIDPAGSHIVLHGGATSGTKTNKALKFLDNFQDGIDLSAATFAGSAIKLAPTQTITDGTITKTLAELTGGGGGSGTVNSGTTGQFAYYGSNGTAVAGHTLIAADIPTLNYVVPPGATNSQSIPYWSADGSKTLGQTTNFKIDSNGAVYRYNGNATGNGMTGIAAGSGAGVLGQSSTGNGISGSTTSGYGAYGYSGSGIGGYFSSGGAGNGVQTATVSGNGGYFESISGRGFFAYQNGALTANTSQPTLEASRNQTLGAYTSTGPIILGKDQTASTGALLSLVKQSVEKFAVDKDGNVTIAGTFIAGYTALTDASATISTDTTRLTVTSTTARTLTLPKTLPTGTSTANLTVVASGAAASVTFAAETGGSISWGDDGAPATTGTVASGKRQRFTCVSENSAATTTAAWDCYRAGGTF